MTAWARVSSRPWVALWLCLALSGAGLLGCKGASSGCSRRAGGDDAGLGQGGSGGVGTDPATEADLSRFGKRYEVLFVGGFMSEVYEEASRHLEDDLNAELRNSARTLNVHIDLPLEGAIDLPIGDAIAEALPWVDLPFEPGGFVTFYTQMGALDERGVAYRNMATLTGAFNSVEGVENNAAAIRKVLRATKKRVVLVTHSKGGLDTLEALLGAPELWKGRVVGWVALQAPFYGSPIADSSIASANDVLLEALGGDGRAADDLKTETRAAYMEANEAKIAELTARIPVISAYSTYEASAAVTGFAGAYAKSIFNAGLVSEISRIVIEQYRETPRDLSRVVAASTGAAVRLVRQEITNALGAAVATLGLVDLANVYMNGMLDLPNDGLVPAQSTRLPGAVHRKLATGDHASPVMDVDPFKNFWPVERRNRVTIGLIAEVRQMARDAGKLRRR